jgi:multiple sugar transport system permease protein
LTRGGPEDATTTALYEAVAAAFDRQQVAVGSAMTVVWFVGVLAVTAGVRKIARRRA